MKTVREGNFKSNEEALADTGFEHLIKEGLSGSDIDKKLIEDEYNKAMKYYEDKGDMDGQERVTKLYREQLKYIME